MQLVFNPKDTNTFASASLDRTIKVGVLWRGGGGVAPRGAYGTCRGLVGGRVGNDWLDGGLVVWLSCEECEEQGVRWAADGRVPASARITVASTTLQQLEGLVLVCSRAAGDCRPGWLAG